MNELFFVEDLQVPVVNELFVVEEFQSAAVLLPVSAPLLTDNRVDYYYV